MLQKFAQPPTYIFKEWLGALGDKDGIMFFLIFIAIGAWISEAFLA